MRAGDEVLAGQQVVQLLCREDREGFLTSTPSGRWLGGPQWTTIPSRGDDGCSRITAVECLDRVCRQGEAVKNGDS
ncbi:MAG: hypothetical protein FJZ90_03090 [Chloroflexi bacterium]|nr:hypothetical protein [Chloroflexota bacterium]